MDRISDYDIVRMHDGRYRLDRATPPVPGPVAYGRGGPEPTLTDANIVLQ